MKKLLCLLILCCFGAALSACGWIENEYEVITPHSIPAPTQEPETEEIIPAATDKLALRALIMDFVRAGSSRNRIDVTDYQGDVTADLASMGKRLEANSLYAYAVDYMDHDVVVEGDKTYLELNMVLRRSAEEIGEIVSVMGMEAVKEQIITSLNNLDSSISIRVSGYQPMDFERFILEYCLTAPGAMVELPEISVSVYPNSGGSRVLEFHFSYTNSKAELRNMQKNMETMLHSVSTFAAMGKDPVSRFTLLGEYLVNRTGRTAGGRACAYDLLCRQEADSCGFASLVYSIAQQCETECFLVQGSRNGSPYWWNIIAIDGEYYHIDMMDQWSLHSRELRLLSDWQMEGYEWSRDSYPPCGTPPEEEEPEPDATHTAQEDEPEATEGESTGAGEETEAGSQPSEAQEPEPTGEPQPEDTPVDESGSGG